MSAFDVGGQAKKKVVFDTRCGIEFAQNCCREQLRFKSKSTIYGMVQND